MTRRIRLAVIGVAAGLAFSSVPLLGQMRGMSAPPVGTQPNPMGQMGQMPMGPGMGRGMMGGEMCPMMKMASAPDAGTDTDAQALAKVFAALGVTDAQKTQMQAVRDQHHTELAALKARAETAKVELRQAVQSLTFDEAAVRVKSAALATVVNDASLAELRIRAEAFKVLTPDQQKKAAEIQRLQQQLTALLKPAVKK
ncbi:MAG TPA: Spy/CpxP family protein refolding chaperone [Vicinamibacterales bacterium]|nr:Spy/CpxP family protein refolding chaperone [Vicinamibacterales bacterium]